jgi:hypothetical protein
MCSSWSSTSSPTNSRTGVIHIGGPGEAHTLFTTRPASGQGAARQKNATVRRPIAEIDNEENADIDRKECCEADGEAVCSSSCLRRFHARGPPRRAFEFHPPSIDGGCHDTGNHARFGRSRSFPSIRNQILTVILRIFPHFKWSLATTWPHTCSRQSLRDRRRLLDAGRPVGRDGDIRHVCAREGHRSGKSGFIRGRIYEVVREVMSSSQ